MNIGELMQGIRKMDFVLPEFQREYVWTREQAKQLLVSLLKMYPTGSLLVWKTDNPPEIKNSAVARDRIGTTAVILDGQQRLTTLYLLTQNAIPPYYRPEDIKNDPRNLYYDLETGDLQFYQLQRMRNNPTWVSIVTCFEDTPINVFKLAQEKAGETDDAFALANTYNTHLTALRGILLRDYPIQTVPPDASIEAAIDVFDRVNSLGTKLSDAELALAHVTGKWPQARQVMKDKMAQLKQQRFSFDLSFFVRALTGVVRGRALYETSHNASEAELKTGWHELGKILDYLVTVLPKWASIHSTDDLNTNNVLIPPIVFLARNEGRFATEKEMRLFIRWLYAASAWARYSSQTDQRLDSDVSVVRQSESPWKKLVDAIIDQRGRIELKAADLEGHGERHPLYRMTYILIKMNGAIDWFNGMPLDLQRGASYGVHSHHIFPQSVLYGDGGYSSDNHLHKQKVNEIANRAFLINDSNLELSNTRPADYLATVELKYPGALQKQFIPLNPALWELDHYEAFLQHRRELIARAYNAQMQYLLSDLPEAQKRSLSDLISYGESAVLEFKSTLRWDVREQRINKDLQKVIAKTIAGFLNSEGGTLLIGVADDGSIFGIERDIDTIQRKDRDGFEQLLVQTLENHIGGEYSPYYRWTFEDSAGKSVCIITVDPSPKPVFLDDKQGPEFYIRMGNTTRPLDTQEAHEYIGLHWES